MFPDGRLTVLKIRFENIEVELEALRGFLHDLLKAARAEIEGLHLENGRLRDALLARLEHESALGSTGYDTMAAHNAAVERIRRLTDTALSRGGPPS